MSTIHEQIARDIAPTGGGRLVCLHPGCDRGERITTADVARYFAHGWPKCHGATMRWITPREDAAATHGPPASEAPR